ncbi:MAG: transglutaminase domain-containing protein [Saprospiraceae bacterium]|nr:transglutaminase domain-containing protein [Saprospiraceae bacterium]
MKNKLRILIVLMLLMVNCTKQKPFHAVEVDNPQFNPKTVFIGYEDLSNPKFNALKEKYQLDSIFHGETDELKRILLLRNWIKNHISIDNVGPYPGCGSAECILDEAIKGHGFHCGHYMVVQNAVMNAYGYVTRCLGAGEGVADGLGEGHHGINEIWLNTFHKWFLSDAKYNYHFEKNGIPLSALEIRDAYLNNRAADITLMEGPDRVPTEFYPELKNRSKELFARIYTWISWDKYNNKYVNWPNDSSDLVMYQDGYFKNHVWIRDGKPHWAYNTSYLHLTSDRKAIEWTPNTISSEVAIVGNKVRIRLNSITPNLKTYQMKELLDGDGSTIEWEAVSNAVEIELKRNRNEIVFRVVNLADITGPEHRVIIERE